MFTGIVEQIGTIVAREPRGVAARLVVSCTWTDLALGESIATSGVCLTVAALRDGAFEADASPETLERSTLNDSRPGLRVNLERALQPQSRMGGHIVSGHVDARGKLLSRRAWGEAPRGGAAVPVASELRFELPKAIARFVAPKGSITIDGISLTVNHVRDTHDADRSAAAGESGGDFDVVVVPHTMKHTTLGDLSVGSPVNLEVDILARYVVRALSRHDASSSSTSTDESLLRALRDGGFLGRS